MSRIFKQIYIYLMLFLIFVVIIIKLLFILDSNLYLRKPKLLCHFETIDDVLPSLDDLEPDENSIFFHKTSCEATLTPRQACAIESAAKEHPSKQIYVLFSPPLYEDKSLRNLYNIENIHFARIHLNFSQDTAVEKFVKKVYNRTVSVTQISEILRFVTLSKWGGIYLDLDTVVVKPLDNLGKNWATKEDEKMINIGAVAFGKNEVGFGIIMKVFEEMKRSYDPLEYTFGSNALNRAIKRYCNVTHVQKVNGTNCNGFKIYGPKLFYPVFWSEYLYYFKPGFLRYQHIEALTHHMWSRLSHNTPIEKGSPYALLAKNNCPKTYELYLNEFGGDTE